MKTVFDNFDSITNWSASGGASIIGVNDIAEFIAGELSHSVILKFNGLGSYCNKAYASPITVGDYTHLIIHVWSQTKGSNHYERDSDFSYKIDIGSGKEYYLKAPDGFDDVFLDITGVTTIDRIRITALTSAVDHLVLSYGVLAKDELPYDIFVGLKEKIDALIAADISTEFLVGAITDVTAGDDSIRFLSCPVWINRYSKIMISDGVHTEYHHISKVDGYTLYFSKMYDGSVLKYSYSSASVYMCFPVEFGKYESEIILPSVSIWGLSPEHKPIESDIQTDLDTWKTDGSVNESTTGQWFSYSLLIDCESMSVELLTEISKVVNKIIARKSLWVNGRKCFIEFAGAPSVIDPTEVVANIPKIQYACTVTIKQDIWDKTRIPLTITINNDYDIINQGDQ
jgi:hypothetical protein